MSIDTSDLLDTLNPIDIGNLNNSVIDLQNKGMPSNIPNRIDNLYNLRSASEVTTNVDTILRLKNKLTEDMVLDNNYNGICVDLDTSGYTLIIAPGSTLLAL